MRPSPPGSDSSGSRTGGAAPGADPGARPSLRAPGLAPAGGRGGSLCASVVDTATATGSTADRSAFPAPSRRERRDRCGLCHECGCLRGRDRLPHHGAEPLARRRPRPQRQRGPRGLPGVRAGAAPNARGEHGGPMAGHFRPTARDSRSSSRRSTPWEAEPRASSSCRSSPRRWACSSAEWRSGPARTRTRPFWPGSPRWVPLFSSTRTSSIRRWSALSQSRWLCPSCSRLQVL